MAEDLELLSWQCLVLLTGAGMRITPTQCPRNMERSELIARDCRASFGVGGALVSFR